MTTPARSLDERIAIAEAAVARASTFDERRVAASTFDALNAEKLAAAIHSVDAENTTRLAAIFAPTTPATGTKAALAASRQALDVRHLTD
jgi:hypothetical protein